MCLVVLIERDTVNKLQWRRDKFFVAKNTRLKIFSSWTLTKPIGESNEKGAGTRVYSMINGHTDNLKSLLFLCQRSNGRKQTVRAAVAIKSGTKKNGNEKRSKQRGG